MLCFADALQTPPDQATHMIRSSPLKLVTSQAVNLQNAVGCASASTVAGLHGAGGASHVSGAHASVHAGAHAGVVVVACHASVLVVAHATNNLVHHCTYGHTSEQHMNT